MGDTQLIAMCKQYCLLDQPRKIIFIADTDVNKTTKILGGENGKIYKSWGNGVYSLVLPIPEHRKTTPEICIEHYYSDDEIKTEFVCDSVNRRLYMGNEFSSYGLSDDGKTICTKRDVCGKGKINIIDGSENTKVLRTDEQVTNLALSKMKFAKCVLEGKPPFDKIDFSNFIPLFEVIRDILFLT